MNLKNFAVIPVSVAALAFSFISIDQLLSAVIPISDNKGFGWIAFQAWAVYFVAGADIKGGVKALIGYVAGIVMTIIIFKLAGLFGDLGFFAVPLSAFIVVSFFLFAEKLPPADFVPAIFIGSGAMVCFLNYIDGATFTNASLVITLYCAIGLFYGYLTVIIRTAYGNWINRVKIS